MTILRFHRTLLAALAATLWLALACTPAVRGDEAPKPDPKAEAARALRALLDAEGEKAKAPLRDRALKLLKALAHDDRLAALRALPFAEADETGTVTLEIKCPDGHTRPNYLRVPGSYDPKKSYPLLVLLHGGVNGAPVAWAEQLLDYWARFLGDKWKDEVLLLAPAAAVMLTDAKAGWSHDVGMGNVEHVIAEVKTRYNVDDDRVFASGMSDGAAGTFALAMCRADSFAGYLPMVGHPMAVTNWGNHCFAGNMKGQNVFAINGGRDPLVPAADLEALFKQLNQDGIAVSYKFDKQAGHDLSFAAIEFPDILDSKVGKWTRGIYADQLKEIDWSCDAPINGRRAWLSIDALADMGQTNAPVAPVLYYPVRLGITLPRPADPRKPVEANTPVVVDSVQAGSTADAMGIKQGDQVIKLDDTEIDGFGKLREVLAKKRFGDKVTVVVKRGDKEETLKGEFAMFVLNPDKPLMARVVARVVGAGQVEIQTYNVSKLSLWTGRGLWSKPGTLKVTINGKSVDFDMAKAGDSTSLLLAEFERTRDRKREFSGRIEIDVARLLGVEPGKKPVKPPVEEDF